MLGKLQILRNKKINIYCLSIDDESEALLLFKIKQKTNKIMKIFILTNKNFYSVSQNKVNN